MAYDGWWWPWRYPSFGCGKDRRADDNKSLNLQDAVNYELDPDSALSALRSSSAAATSQWPCPWLIRHIGPTATHNLQTSHKGVIAKAYVLNKCKRFFFSIFGLQGWLLILITIDRYFCPRNAQKLRHFCPSRCKQWWVVIEIQLLHGDSKSGEAWHKRLKAQADPTSCLAPHGTHSWECRSPADVWPRTQHNWISCWKC